MSTWRYGASFKRLSHHSIFWRGCWCMLHHSWLQWWRNWKQITSATLSQFLCKFILARGAKSIRLIETCDRIWPTWRRPCKCLRMSNPATRCWIKSIEMVSDVGRSRTFTSNVKLDDLECVDEAQEGMNHHQGHHHVRCSAVLCSLNWKGFIFLNFVCGFSAILDNNP